ncbi:MULTISPECIES: TetR/AcrR family transcriptional regulator [unclassified Streptomyces]|uniref:TetR/AcrR family transcriptional regulator n=1 Tax=unclassified Streptomyces TaxID=2593676 RepID=UPI00363F628A
MTARSASPPRRPGPRGADMPAVPEERDILLRGLETFAELGYDRTSARELARRLGVSHNFINDRYGSKAAFWRAVVDFALGSQMSRLGQAAPDADDAERLRRLITDFYRTSVDTPCLGQLCVDEFSRDTERLDYLYERYVAPTLALITPSVEALIASGRMAPVPIDMLFFALVSPASGLVQLPLAQRLGRPESMSLQERIATAERLASLVVDGLLSTGSRHNA